MTLYAHTTDGTIDQVGALPALWLGPTRWHDWRGEPATWATQPADWGWLPVVETPRPADTETTTSDPAPVALIDGVPTQQWTVRPWTAEELAAQAEAEQQQARYVTHEAILDATAALMEQAHTDGEPWIQPTGAHNAIPYGRAVTDGGKTWRSKHYANVWPPSPSSPWWEEVTNGDPGPQPWALGTYYKPPTKVTFAGKTYECTFEHLAQPGWGPNNPTMHAVWKLT